MTSWIVSFVFLFCAPVFAGVQPINEVFSPDPVNYPSGDFAKVAVVAWVSTDDAPITNSERVAEAYKQKNRRALERYIREAAANGAQLVVTPEFSVVGYPAADNFRSPAEIAPYAEPIPGQSTQFFAALARELQVYIQFGMAEQGASDKYYNSAVVVGPSGAIEATYRKINLFGGESRFLYPGSRPATYDTPFGRIGILICADVYSRSPLAEYRGMGVDVLAMGASWTTNGPWSTFTGVASSERRYLLVANHTYHPDSGVINPDGSSQSHIRQSAGVAYGYLPKGRPANP